MVCQVFISHASEDKPFARQLQKALKNQDVDAWIDHRELTEGGDLDAEIKKAIKEAKVFLSVWTLAAMKSGWVYKELSWAKELNEKQESYKIIPIILGNEITPEIVKNYIMGRDILSIVQDDNTGFQETMGRLLAALGITGQKLPDPPKVEELVLILSHPKMVEKEGKLWGQAVAELEYLPAVGATVEGEQFTLDAPLGPIEADELSWYLELFTRWPGKAFQPRAQKVASLLPVWGKALFDTALDQEPVRHIRQYWQNANPDHQRRITIRIKSSKAGNDALAAAHLLSLPWEIVHNGENFLFSEKTSVRVRRRLPNFNYRPSLFTPPPLRVLLVSPRPEEEDRIGYIDHRVTALPMAEALATLGTLAELVVLQDPSFAGVIQALQLATEQKRPFHVVHFNGHGIYLKNQELGALCFEQAGQQDKLADRTCETVNGEKLAEALAQFRIPLFFLEACQSSKADVDPTSSVAGQLMSAGVAAVAAMSHSVLVTTAREFVTVFYQHLARGARVGDAMLAGQRHLSQQKKRGYYLGAGELELEDWFVPVLYQEGKDFPLVQQIPTNPVPSHRHVDMPELDYPFVGRSREILSIERLLLEEKYGVLLGEGGEGKTALACEAARWLAMIHRVERVVFISCEVNTHVNAILAELGRQLVGQTFTKGAYSTEEQALLAVERELAEGVTLLVLDNMETILPPRPGGQAGSYDEDELNKILALLHRMQGVGQTRLLFTSREAMPPPFAAGHNHVAIGRLAEWDGVELVKNVLQQKGVPPAQEEGIDREQILLDLVNSVHGHARTLVLLAPELVDKGVTKTTENLHHLMARLEQQHPGERECSLYAGVALSLNRLSPATRQAIKPLGVFQGGGHLGVIGDVLEIQDKQKLLALAAELAQTGLCNFQGNNYLTFHFALCPFLWGEMTGEEQEKAWQRWLEGEYQFVNFLYKQLSQDTQLASGFTLLDMANLLAGLERAAIAWPVERALDWEHRLALLVKQVGKKSAGERVAAIRDKLAAQLGEGWSHTHYQTQDDRIGELASQGRIGEACQAAMGLLQRCLAAGEGAYEGADYDVARAYFIAGRFTQMVGNAVGATPLLQESRSRFLTMENNPSAREMVATTLNDQGDCLLYLGKLDEAAQFYQQGGQESEQIGVRRGLAISQLQLGTVRLLQRRFPEALAAYEQARQTFAKLQEPATLASTWHQSGMVLQEMAAWAQAEEAYGKALEIRTKLNDLAGEADTLLQLGNLFDAQNRWEEAVIHYNNAASIYIRLGNLANEGRARNNLADTLQKLDKLEEARQEILRALECYKPFGHATEPWTAWHNLAKIETKAGHSQAAGQARQQARQLFAQSRRAGRENYETGARWCQITAVAIQQGQVAEWRQQLEEAAQNPQLPPAGKALAQVLLAILAGQREGGLADREGLFYNDAVEVELLLEQLNKA